MKSVFEEYYNLWPESSHADLRPLLSKVPVLHYPENKAMINSVVGRPVILVVDNTPLNVIMDLVGLGFEHIVQKGREDFAAELLASSLMTLKPESFLKNPVPFFLSGFNSDEMVKDPDRYLILRFTKSSEKETLLDWLGVFLDRETRTSSIRDLCLQSADEMITNALFNAPMMSSKKRPFKDLARTSEIELPSSMSAKIFACFNEDRVVIGCQDPYGSLKKVDLVNHLVEVLKVKDNEFSVGGGGAGLGIRYLIENSANFYTLVNPGKSTLMACGYLLKGLKANMTVSKHLHLRFD